MMLCLLFVLGCEFHDVSFGPGQTKGSWSSELHPDRENWSFYSYIGGGHTGTVFPSTIRNPNKAICTINSKTSEVMKRPVQPPKFMIMMHKKLSSTFFKVKKPQNLVLIVADMFFSDPYCKWYDLWTLWVWNRGVVGQKTQGPYQVKAQRTSYNTGVPLWRVLGKHCQSCWKSGKYSYIIGIRFFPALKITYLPHKSIEMSVFSHFLNWQV